MPSEFERQAAVTAASDRAPDCSFADAVAGVEGLGFTFQPSERTTDSQMRFARSKGGRTIVIVLEQNANGTAWVSVSTFGAGRVSACDMNPTNVPLNRVSSVLSSHLVAHGLMQEVQAQAGSAVGDLSA